MDANPYAAPQIPSEPAKGPRRWRITVVDVIVLICVVVVLACILVPAFKPAVEYGGPRQTSPASTPSTTVETVQSDAEKHSSL
jgi:hypothetical protein